MRSPRNELIEDDSRIGRLKRVFQLVFQLVLERVLQLAEQLISKGLCGELKLFLVGRQLLERVLEL